MTRIDEENKELTGRVRAFLMKMPRPTIVRVVSCDGGQHDVSVPTRPRWIDVAVTIVTLDPAVLHALDEEGGIIRGEKLVEDATVGTTEERGGFREIPVPAALSSDPETQRLTHFANLLERAHEKSNDFVKEFGQIIMDRTDSLEARLERTEAAYKAEFHARMQAELRAMQDGEGDSKDEMMKSFFGSYFGAKGGAPNAEQAPKSNGNGERRPPRGWWSGGGDG